MIDYTKLDALYTTEEKERFAWVREQIPELGYKPLISIVVPVYKTPVRLLDEMIASVERQSYVNWELCIVNASTREALEADASAKGAEQSAKELGDAAALSARLKEWSEYDLRIRVKDLPANKGISGNTNEAFAMAGGEFTAMLDHDDLLTEDALGQIVLALNTAPDRECTDGYWDFLYSDQDMIDEESTHRFNPLYKPAYSRELLYSGNYITHFSVIRTKVLRSFGGWDPDTDGAQDWDVFLKTVEKTDKVIGIPLVLYHWRMASTSTASSMATKSYALDAQCRAVTNHMHRMGYPDAKADFYDRGIYKMQILWGKTRSDAVSVILLDDNPKKDIRMQQLMAHAALQGEEKEILVISGEELAAKGRWRCICDAANRAEGETLLFLSGMCTPKQASALTELADWTFYDRIGLVSPTYVTWDDRILEMGIAMKETGPVAMFEGEFADGTTSAGKCYWYRNVHACSESCFAVKRSVMREEMEKVSGWPEFCLKLERKGYHHMVTPFAKMVPSPGWKSLEGIAGEEISGEKNAREAMAALFAEYIPETEDCYYRR